MLKCGIFVFMIFCSAASMFAGVSLVDDGKVLSDIVISKDAISSVKTAAEDLRKYIELISGAKLDIVNAPSEKFKNHIYVGPSEYTAKLGIKTDDLKVEGFKIIAKDNYLVLIGHDEQRTAFPYDSKTPGDLEKWQKFAGEKYNFPEFSQSLKNTILGFRPLDATATLYAVSEFLEQLGVRFYAPYENGTVIPSKKTIIADYQNLKKEPRFPYREFHYAMRNDPDGIMWFKRMKYGCSYIYFCNHTTRNILSSPEIKKEHPEYYAMSNGKLIGGNREVPKLTDPGFRKTSLNFLNKVFSAYPFVKDYSLGMPDGFTEIDEQDAVTWDRSDKEGKFSDYIWDYWLWVAQELKKSNPDKRLTCMAYSTYLQPPSKIDKLPDNVTLTMCYWTTWLITSQGKDIRNIRAKWLDKLSSKKLYIWDYYLFYRENGLRCPVFFTKLLQEEMKALDGVCEGKFIEIASEKKGDPIRLSCPGLSHMLHYWQGKLYWNPDMDREKMMNEYYELYFGPAKAEMKEFYEFAEEVWMRPESRSITLSSGFLKEKDVERYFDILKRAREKAGAGSVYDKRIAQIENEIEPLKKLFENLKKRNGPEFRAFVRPVHVTADGDLEKTFWTEMKNWYTLCDPATGKSLPGKSTKQTQVAFRFARDKANLFVGLKCYEPNMDKIVANAKNNDDKALLADDSVEIYIETPERSGFRIIVNSNGAVYDESTDTEIVERDTTPLLWNSGAKAIVRKEKNMWSVELVIPMKDFGKTGPTKAFPWGINITRNRMVDGKIEKTVLVAPDKNGSTLLGNLVMR